MFTKNPFYIFFVYVSFFISIFLWNGFKNYYKIQFNMKYSIFIFTNIESFPTFVWVFFLLLMFSASVTNLKMKKKRLLIFSLLPSFSVRLFDWQNPPPQKKTPYKSVWFFNLIWHSKKSYYLNYNWLFVDE